MRLSQYNTRVKSAQTFVAPARLEDWNRMNSTFQAMTGYYAENNSETSSVLPEKVRQAFVASRFCKFGELHRNWVVTLARRNSILVDRMPFSLVTVSGESIRRQPQRTWQETAHQWFFLSIIGVMPASFLFPDREVDLWTPIPADAPYANSRRFTWYTVIGRLKPGMTLTEAQAG